MNPQFRESNPSDVSGWGRWDTPGHTIYAAETEFAAYVEALAYQVPSTGLQRTPTTEVFLDDEPHAGTILDAIADEWRTNYRIDPFDIVQGWRDARNLYALTVPDDGWAIDITHGDSIASINRALPSAKASWGIATLTQAHLAGDDRQITVSIATELRRLTLDDGSLAYGIVYPSKHGREEQCWAIWLRSIDNGFDAASEPTTVKSGITIRDAQHNNELQRAAAHLRLRIL